MSVYRKFDAATVLHHAKIEVAAAEASKPTKADTEVSKTLGALETLGAGPPRIHTSVGSESPSPEATDLRDLFEERAGIHQFDAGYRRDVAERLAYDATIEEWCR